MKALKIIGMAVFAMIISVVTTSCKDDEISEDSIAGTAWEVTRAEGWELNDRDISSIYIFTKESTGYLVREDEDYWGNKRTDISHFKWAILDGKLTLYWTNSYGIADGYDNIQGTFKITGDKATWIGFGDFDLPDQSEPFEMDLKKYDFKTAMFYVNLYND